MPPLSSSSPTLMIHPSVHQIQPLHARRYGPNPICVAVASGNFGNRRASSCDLETIACICGVSTSIWGIRLSPAASHPSSRSVLMGKKRRRERRRSSSDFPSRPRIPREKRENPARAGFCRLTRPLGERVGAVARAGAEEGNERRGSKGEKQWTTRTAGGFLRARLRKWLLRVELGVLTGVLHAGHARVDARDIMDPVVQSMLNDGGDNIECNYPGGMDPLVESAFPSYSPGWGDSSTGERTSQKGKSKKCANMTSRKNWKAEEEALLLSAWLNVSQDSIVGTDQSAASYWGKIVKYCEDNANGNWTTRSQKAIINHWQTISAESSKFAGYMQKVDDIHPSGTTVDDRIGMAMKMFKDLEGRSYAYMHLWSTLSKHPKWCAYLDGKRKKEHDVAPAHSSPATPATGHSSPVAHDAQSGGAPQQGRPIGRDAARKARARGASGSTSSVGMGTGMFADQLDRIGEQKARLANIWDREVAILERQEDDKIMAMDLSGMDEASRQYFTRRKEMIASRYGP